MSRRTVAMLLAAGILGALVVVAALLPVPYVTVSPGPTVNVLSSDDDEPVIEVEGERSYPTDGELRLTTVSVTNPETDVSLVRALGGWLRPEVDVLPYSWQYPEPRTIEEERAESAAQMVSSQDTAIAVALGELGHEVPMHAEVIGVVDGGPSDGVLKVGDILLRAGGEPVDQVQDLLDVADRLAPGDVVELRVRRDGRPVDVEVTTKPASDNLERALLGITLGTGYQFPFDIDVRVDERIGGPSAGLIFALSVYDTLTPGALTGGRSIAGTGTIGWDGSVGPIGGIRQKIYAAEDAGAELFLVPAANCPSASSVDTDTMRLVRADTLRSAIDSLETYADDPSADLPRCPT